MPGRKWGYGSRRKNMTPQARWSLGENGRRLHNWEKKYRTRGEILKVFGCGANTEFTQSIKLTEIAKVLQGSQIGQKNKSETEIIIQDPNLDTDDSLKDQNKIDLEDNPPKQVTIQDPNPDGNY